MQLLGYSLLILIALEWTFSESFTIIDNLPSREVEAKLKKYLDAKKNDQKTPKKKENKQKTENGEKVEQKSAIERLFGKKKKPLNLCKKKTTFNQRRHLCYETLRDNRYQVFTLRPGTVPECTIWTIAGMGDGYQLPMFTCDPAKNEQPPYLMGSTDEDEASFYLFKAEWEEGHYKIYVEAFITLSEEDLYHLKRVKKEENRWSLERLVNGLNLGPFYEKPIP